jgi:prolyl-tRNA editing enzyme YbaK/EbsC (Cys-tRNA(Pro) deacylase)
MSHGPPAGARSLSASAQRVQDTLTSLGHSEPVFELPIPVRTAADAAREVGCEVGQIAKSLIFRAQHTGRPVLVIASGANRVDVERLHVLLGEPIVKADPDFVREHTGYSIGGIPPVGHVHRIETLIDEDLLHYQRIWAAAGHPNALFPLAPADLVRMAGGRVVRIT